MTTYRVARNPGDYRAAHVLMKDEGFLKQSIGFPTILAYRDTELIGFVGTKIVDKMIVAGPLCVKSGRGGIFTAIRLAEAYESAMKELGISTFILPVEDDSFLDKAIRRYHPELSPYALDGKGVAFYTWRIGYGRRWSERSEALSGGAAASASAG